MSQISTLMFFFVRKKELFSSTYLLQKTPRRTKILISPAWNKILKIWDKRFELINIELECCKNYFKTFLQQEAGAFGNNIVKQPQKPRPKLKNMYIIYLLRILLSLQANASSGFLLTCINFVELRHKFSHFEDSIIP